MDRRNRDLVRAELARLEGPLDRWDTSAIARALGDDPHAAFLGERYTGRVTARLAASVLRARILQVYWQTQEPPTAPPLLLDVDNVPIHDQTLNLTQLLEPWTAAEIARRSGLPRTTVQRIKAGATRTSPEKIGRLLRAVDESLADAFDNWIAEATFAYRAWLAPVMEQIARTGPVREWAAGRQRLPKLRRRLDTLDEEISRAPNPRLIEQRQEISARIAQLEDVDDHPPHDPELERQALAILESQRRGLPRLAAIGIDPGGDLHRARQTLAGFGLKDIHEVNSIDERRVYKLRVRTRP
jgi:transcriptional regulator with XRE-family HTH domain